MPNYLLSMVFFDGGDGRMKHSLEMISKEIRSRVEAEFPVLLTNLAEELAYDFMFTPKYKITHEYDSPWDCSGMLVQENDLISVDDYYSVEDFFDEYTGQSTASYTSGIGFLHNSFGEKYEDVVREFVFGCYIEVLSETDNNLLIQQLLAHGYDISGTENEDIIQAVTDYELFEEPFWYHLEIIERVKPLSLKMMVARGKNGAIKKHHHQLARRIEEDKKISFEQNEAYKIWNKLQKLFRLQKGYSLPKIEMKDYIMFSEFLEYNRISYDEKIFLAKYMGNKFSNKVCVCLKDGQGINYSN